MNLSKNSNKLSKLLAIIMTVAMVLSMLPVGVFAADGRVHVIVENTTFTEATDASDGKEPAWSGNLVVSWVDLKEDSTMMNCIKEAIEAAGKTQTGADSGYISEINGLAEKQNGDKSGWMGTLNDWFTNEGFNQYSVENGKLKAGDEIRVMYSSSGLGKDIGGDWEDADKRLASLAVTGGELAPAFSSDNHSYTLTLSEGTNFVTVAPTAKNKQFQVKVFVGETEYAKGAEIPAVNGTEVTVKCGDPSWPSGAPNTGEAQVYSIKVVSVGTMLSADSLSIKTIKEAPSSEGADIALTFDSSKGVYTGTLSAYTHLAQYNDAGFTATLSGLPEGATAKLVEEDGTKLADFVDGKATVNAGVAGKGVFNFYIVVSNNAIDESYKLILKKEYKGYWTKVEFAPSLFSQSHIYNGQPEGTLFQADREGNLTGGIGLSSECYDYVIFISPGVKTIKPKNQNTFANNAGSSFPMKADKYALYVNDSLIAQNLPNAISLGMKFKVKGAQITGDKTVVKVVWGNKKDATFEICSTFTFIVVKTSTDDFIKYVEALPKSDSLTYSEHYNEVKSLVETYDYYSDEEKSKISEETVKKLEISDKRVDELKLRHENGINELSSLVNSYAGKITDENYKNYLDDVRKAEILFLSLDDAQRKELGSVKKLYWESYYAVTFRAIKDGLTIGYPTLYPDDFMLRENYYNLDLGHEDTYYETGFREIWTNRPQTAYNYQEKGLPFTSPGLLEFDIKDDSIFEIKEVEEVYTDQGLGGSGDHSNMRYYLVPKKAGTTTFTVKMRDEAGVMYCQTPEIVVHVNSPEESSIENLCAKLTDITSQEYTRKYDNWNYEYGTDGAEFTFRINGGNGKAWVYSYLEYNADGTPVKTEYIPNENGDVTVLLKDGYNCIEVNADYEGKNVTQVYALKGKVVRFVTVNETRPGEALRVGDMATVWTIGKHISLHKISRIYNNGNGFVRYITDMPMQSRLTSVEGIYAFENTDFTGKAEAGDYPRLEVPLTGSGKIVLRDGYLENKGYGSSIYSEFTQGNTGGIAASTAMIFGRLADITLEVDGDPDYRLPEGMQTVVSDEGVVKAGEQITVTVPELPIDELKEKYESGESNTIKTAELVFYTNIPGILKIGNEYNKYVSPDEGSVSTIEDIRSITFSIPEETPAGIYTIHGGFVDMLVTKGWMDYYPLEYRGMINDATITVLPSDAQEVEALIDEIGDVTLESEKAIKTARGAYELLTEEQKLSVKNYQKLLDAEETFDKLKAEETEKLINKIGKVNKNSEDKIKAARDAYDKLTEDQKKLVSSDNLKKLEEAEAAYAKLLKENGPKTGDSASIAIYAIMLVAAAATGTVVYKKKKKA